MATKDEQICALLEGRTYELATQELGITKLTVSSYAQVFTVTRDEIDAYVARNGIPSSRYHSNDTFSDGIHFLFDDGGWRVYDRERGIKFNNCLPMRKQREKKSSRCCCGFPVLDLISPNPRLKTDVKMLAFEARFSATA